MNLGLENSKSPKIFRTVYFREKSNVQQLFLVLEILGMVRVLQNSCLALHPPGRSKTKRSTTSTKFKNFDLIT